MYAACFTALGWLVPAHFGLGMCWHCREGHFSLICISLSKIILHVSFVCVAIIQQLGNDDRWEQGRQTGKGQVLDSVCDVDSVVTCMRPTITYAITFYMSLYLLQCFASTLFSFLSASFLETSYLPHYSLPSCISLSTNLPLSPSPLFSLCVSLLSLAPITSLITLSLVHAYSAGHERCHTRMAHFSLLPCTAACWRLYVCLGCFFLHALSVLR